MKDRSWQPLWLVGMVLLLTQGAAGAADTVLVRIGAWLAPERVAEFGAAFEHSIVPLLERHGLVLSEQQGRATVDSVYSRLFECPTAADAERRINAYWTDPVVQVQVQELIERFGVVKPFGHIYDQPAAPGEQVPAGRGQGHWRTYDLSDGLLNSSLGDALEDRDGYLWVASQGGGVGRFDGQAFRMFTTADGLGSNSIGGIVQDQSGYLWFVPDQTLGHQGVVSRFDGESFATLPFAHAECHTIKRGGGWREDDQHRLWIISREGRLCRFDGETSTVLTTADGLPSDWMRSVERDGTGAIWLSTDGGLARFDGTGFTTFTAADGLPGDGLVKDLTTDRQDRLWMASDYGLVRFDGTVFTTFTAADGLPDDEVQSLLAGRKHLWILTKTGLSSFDGQSFTTLATVEDLPGEPGLLMLEDSQGHLWFGAYDGGLLRFDGQSVVRLTVAEGLAGNGVGKMLEDREGNLWFATNAGLSRYTHRRFTRFGPSDGLPTSEVLDLVVAPGGGLWISGRKGELSYFDGQHFTNYSGTGFERGVGRISLDRQGNLWCNSHNSDDLSRFDGVRIKTFTAVDGLGWTDKLLEDRQGGLWLRSGRNQIARYDGQRATYFSLGDSLDQSVGWMSASLEDRQGHLWFALSGAGVFRFDGVGFRQYTTKDGLPSDQVWSLLEDRQGHLWFGTYGGGLARFDGERFTTYGPEDGLPSQFFMFGYAALEDRQGHLWFGTDGGGVVRYDGRTFQSLNQKDGLAGNVVRSIAEDQEGHIWIGGSGGLTRYQASPAVPPPVSVDGVVADRRYAGGDAVSLPSSAGLVSFEFHALSLKTRPGAMVFRYRLQGHDEAWRTTQLQRVEYQDLGPGSYTFEVEAVDQDLVYSATPALVRLRIRWPYERIGLWSVLVLALGLAVWQSARVLRRDRRLHAANIELQSALEAKEQAQEALVRSESMAAIGTLAAGAAHELNNPLGAAASLVQATEESMRESAPEEVLADLEMLADDLAFSRQELDRAKEIVASLLELSHQSQDYTEEVGLTSAVQDALRGLRGHYDAQQIAVIEEYQAELPPVQGNFAQLVQVAFNIIQNAIQALGDQSGTVTLRTYATAVQVVFECSDTGPGMAEEVRQDIFKPFFTTKAPGSGTGLGLYVCYQVADKHGGTIEVDSVQGQGARFRVGLPIP